MANEFQMTTQRPKVSVVIPMYNAEQFIIRALQSVLQQDLAAIEVIVVDDGSTDQCRQLVEQIQDERLTLLTQVNNGVSAARNLGLSKIKSKYVYFLDADDILAKTALSRCYQLLQRSPKFVAVYGETLTFTEDDDIEATLEQRSTVLAPRPHGHILSDLIKGNFICTGAIMLRTKTVRQLNGFCTSLKLGEDWAYWVELATWGDFCYLPMPVLSLYRQHPHSAARQLAIEYQNLEPAIEYIYSLHLVKNAIPNIVLLHDRQSANAAAYFYAAQELLKIGQWQNAKTVFLKSIYIRPWRIRSWILLLCSMIRYVPQIVRRGLK
jgi:glycosyltransferase involved in cell wall biosynthesis